MSDFNLVLFKGRLAETIAYCRPRVALNDRENSLRSLSPLDESDKSDWLVDESKLVRFANQIFEQRPQQILSLNLPIQENPDLQGGKLLVMLPYFSDSSGAEYMESDGFIDGDAFPAWDTWIYIGWDHIYNRGNHVVHGYYLISWIPPEFIHLTDLTIKASATGCIMWLDNIEDKHFDFTFATILRDAGFLGPSSVP